ncbi:MAG: hypothetical protein ACLRPR_01130 [Eisenbergiella sp.]
MKKIGIIHTTPATIASLNALVKRRFRIRRLLIFWMIPSLEI